MERKVYEFISKQMNDPIVERRTCRRTGEEFAIFQGDVDLLDKISPVIAGKKFPLPLHTLSPLARMRRRMMFRNERAFYKNTSVISKGNIISLYHPDTGIPVVSSKDRAEIFVGENVISAESRLYPSTRKIQTSKSIVRAATIRKFTAKLP